MRIDWGERARQSGGLSLDIESEQRVDLSAPSSRIREEGLFGLTGLLRSHRDDPDPPQDRSVLMSREVQP